MTKSGKSFSEKDRVVHGTYGSGTITLIGDAHTIIEFDEHGRRKFVTELLKMEHSDIPAPTRTRKRAAKSAK
ncbi:MAG: hypothetical protein ACREAA_10070 [Candidatus Polarisedimenticolia bacterium]